MRLGERTISQALCGLALCLFMIGCSASETDNSDGDTGNSDSSASADSSANQDDNSDADDSNEQANTDTTDGQTVEANSDDQSPEVTATDEPQESTDVAEDASDADDSDPQVTAADPQEPPNPDTDAADANDDTVQSATAPDATPPGVSDQSGGSDATSDEVRGDAQAIALDDSAVGNSNASDPQPPKEAGVDQPQAAAADGGVADSPDSEAGEDAAAEADASAADSVTDDAAASDAAQETAGDWPMWGGTIGRNMVNSTTGISLDFDPIEGKNILWTGELGSQTYGNPVVAGGRVYVGTNNGAGLRPKHPASEDRGVIMCFDEKSGEFQWQLTREKMPSGRVNDWPQQGICSSPSIVGDRMYVVTNRCELMCLDVEGFHDGENDGPYTDEVDNEELDADIIWILDMYNDLGVFPHNLATSSPVVHNDMIFLLTSNGVDEAHLELPSPRAPDFIAVNRETGEVVWENDDPFDQVLHGQWSSPAIGVVDGVAQVYFPGGDGILRALNAMSGEEIWRFDLNPKETVWELGGRGTRNAIISTPVFIEDSVLLAVGQDPEHGEGVGHLYRIDATKKGDISPELGEIGSPGEANPNSGVIWHYGGEDHDGSVTGREGGEIYRRTMSTVAVHNGLVIAPDLSGRVHCVDFKTGKRYWEHDLLAELWGSPMIADGKIFLGDENGDLNVFELGEEANVMEKIMFPSSIYSTPTIANGVMYVSDRSTLYAIKIRP